MTTPWYQFSLRSLLLFTLFVAVVYSIGVCTHWLVSVAIGVGGILGRTVAGKEAGYVFGVAFGMLFAAITFFLAVALSLLAIAFVRHSEISLLVIFWLVAALIGDVAGSVLGGRMARKPPGK